MKQADKFIENQGAYILFPSTASYCAQRGVYIMPEGRMLIKAMAEGVFPLENVAESARLRVELACAALWPYVKELFEADFFPHLQTAAINILRAVDFCDADEIVAHRLAAELAAALTALEETLNSAAAPCIALAAEPEEI